MSYSVGEAAKATGKSKSTISRAIDAGRISAERRDDGSYRIDAAELHRVFPPATVAERDNEAPRDSSRNPVAEVEAKVLTERVAGLERELRARDDQIRDLRHGLDQAHEEKLRLTALLTAREPMPASVAEPVAEPVARRSIWPWRRGRISE